MKRRVWFVLAVVSVLSGLFAVPGAWAQVSVSITTPATPLIADVGEPAAFGFTAAGGTPPYTWTANPVPSGFAFDPVAAVLSGAASQPGAWSVALTVRDSLGGVATRTFLLAADTASATREAFRNQVAFTANSSERLLAVAAKPGGTMVVAGYIVGSRARTPVVGEVDAAGSTLWNYKGAPGYDAAGLGAGADAAGNAYGISSPGLKEHLGSVTLLKFSPAGNLLWSYMLPDEGKPQYEEHLAVDPSGRSLVVRHIRYNYGTVLETTAVSPDGAPLWVDRVQAAFAARAVRLDSTGRLFIVGTLSAPTGDQAWVRTLSPDGTLLGWRQYAPSGWAAEATGEGIDFAPSGDAFLFLGLEDERAAVEHSGALLRLNATGDVVWEQTNIPAASAFADGRKAVAADAQGLVFVAATIYDARGGAMDQLAVLAFRQADGAYLGRRLFGDVGLSETFAAAAPDANGFYAAGTSANAAGASLGFTAGYLRIPSEAPTFSPAGGVFAGPVQVTLDCATPGAVIAYTTDGSAPSEEGPQVAPGSAILVSGSVTLRAVAFVPGSAEFGHSVETSADYVFAAAQPTFSPAGGYLSAIQDVTITSSTLGASIVYTTDGTVPSAANGTVIPNGGSVTVATPMTLQAVALLEGWLDSPVAIASYLFRAGAPTFSPPGGAYRSGQVVKLLSSSPGAQIIYTTDGTVPSATNGTVAASGATITLTGSLTLSAYAVVPGWEDSALTSAAYVVTTVQAAVPTLSPTSGTYDAVQTVVVSSASAGATIRYTTDGTMPTTENGTALANGGTVTVDRSMTLKAIACSDSLLASAAASGTYTLRVVAPVIAPGTSSALAPVPVTLTSPTQGVSIMYTIDGSTPTPTNGIELANGGTVTVDRSATLKAIAWRAGWTPSAAASATYTLRASLPVFAPGTTTGSAPLTVTITTPTPGAEIHYTTDGSTPTATTGTVLASGGTVTIDRTTSLKAIAWKEGWSASSMVSATYTLKVEPLTLTPGATSSTTALAVVIRTNTADAQIRYTTDGTTPSATVGTLLANGGTVTIDRTTTLKAVAYKDGWAPCTAVTATYTLKVAALVATPGASTSLTSLVVRLSSATTDAQIRYTTDGTTPSADVGTPIANGGTIAIDRTTTIKAVAYKTGWTPTTVLTALYTLKVSPLVLTPGTTTSLTPIAVKLTCATVGASIRYTTDGTIPSADVGTLVASGDTVLVDRTTTLKAVAFRTGWTPSTVVTATYTLKVPALVLTPGATSSLTPVTVKLSCVMTDALIRYTTDGTAPTADVGTPIANGGTVLIDRTTTLKALAYKPGWTSSAVVTALYTLKVSPLVMTPATTSTAPITVTFSSAMADALIHYTTDGTMPSAAVGTPVANGGSVVIDRTTTVKAVAYKDGWTSSAVVTTTYTLKVAPIVLTPGTTTSLTRVTVTLESATTGALINYTTDGTIPSADVGTPIANGGTVLIDRTTTLRAIGYLPGWTPSTVATATYTLKVSPLTVTPGTGTYNTPQTVTFATDTLQTVIAYTTDGSIPSDTNGTQVLNGASVLINRNTPLKAIALRSGWTPSAVVSTTYTLKPQAVTMTPGTTIASAPLTVTLATVTNATTISYTTDGTIPSETNGTVVANGGTVLIDRTTTLKAVAIKAGWSLSDVTTATYTLKVEPLVLTPGTTLSVKPLTVTLQTPTDGALIRYTTDGTQPTREIGTELANGGTVTIDRTTTLKAIAYKPGWTATAAVTATYTLRVAAPNFSVPAGIYVGAQTVAVSTPTTGAVIRYTLDGTIPTRTAGTVIANGETVTVPSTATLRAIAYKVDASWSDSLVTMAAYTIR